MLNNSTPKPENQAQAAGKNYEKYERKQRNIDEEREEWAERKRMARSMAARMAAIQNPGRSFRIGQCADYIIADLCLDCETRYIIGASFCHDRLCPLCSFRRARRLTKKLGSIISMCAEEGKHRYILLTLTVKNVPWAKLKPEIRKMLKAWNKLSKRIKRAAAVTGWVRTFEVTRGKDGLAHPHIHVLMQVPPEYFCKSAGLHYHDHAELMKAWRECFNTDYDPWVHIQAIKETDYDLGKAICEVTKYMAKGSDVLGLEDEDFKHYVEAVRGVRAWSTGGSMRIPDAEIEDFLHGGAEPTHEPGKCGKCGGKLQEIREEWDEVERVYKVRVRLSYEEQKAKYMNARQIIINNYGGSVSINGWSTDGHCGGASIG